MGPDISRYCLTIEEMGILPPIPRPSPAYRCPAPMLASCKSWG